MCFCPTFVLRIKSFVLNIIFLCINIYAMCFHMNTYLLEHWAEPSRQIVKGTDFCLCALGMLLAMFGFCGIIKSSVALLQTFIISMLVFMLVKLLLWFVIVSLSAEDSIAQEHLMILQVVYPVLVVFCTALYYYRLEEARPAGDIF